MAIRLFANLGLTAAGRLGDQPEAGPALVSLRRAPVAHAGAPTKAYRPASWASSRAGRPVGTLEYGFRASYPRGRAIVSDSDRGG